MRLLPLYSLAALGLTNQATAATPQPKRCPTAIGAIDAAAQKTLRQGSPGMIIEVAQNGELLFSGTYGKADLEQGTPVTPDTVFRLASVTKPFMAAAVLALVDDGKLSLSDRLARHVPEIPAAAEVRIYELLTHTSGISDYAEDPDGAEDEVGRQDSRGDARLDRKGHAQAAVQTWQQMGLQ
jgi:CubicO group peptidase (beta-lactamase class C family)